MLLILWDEMKLAQKLADEQERAGQVDVDGLPPLLQGHLGEGHVFSGNVGMIDCDQRLQVSVSIGEMDGEEIDADRRGPGPPVHQLQREPTRTWP